MRHVKMLISQAGPTIQRVPGAVYEVSDKEAKHLIKTGQAEPMRGVMPRRETAALNPAPAVEAAAAKPASEAASKADAKETADAK